MLGADDPLPARPRRVLVAGTSGAGKTTFARQVAEELNIPHVEIGALFHGPNWTPRDSFEADVRRFTATLAWVTEWQYRVVRDLLAERADLVVWLDVRRVTVMYRVLRRTLLRRLHQEVLWNGNVGPPLRSIFTDHQHIDRMGLVDAPQDAAEGGGIARTRIPIVRLTRGRAADRWLEGPLRLAMAARS